MRHQKPFSLFRLGFLLLLVLASYALRAQNSSGNGRFENEIAAFEKADAENPPKTGSILFIGSSSIRLWKTLEQDFPDHSVLNRGFGGSEISDSVALVDRIVVPYKPKLIVMYAGGNDINAGKTPEQVAEDFKQFVNKVRSKLPDESIDYISMAGNPARWPQVEKVKTANGLIRQYCQETTGLKYIDVFSPMLGTDGLPRPEIFGPDKLHMNAEGYKLWTEIIRPYLP